MTSHMDWAPGVLASHQILALIDGGHVTGASSMPAMDAIQPASLDLRLGRWIWGLRAGFCPGAEPIAETIESLAMFRMDLADLPCLVPGLIYIAEIEERMDLPPDIGASFSPKSSTGRLDVFTRVLADGVGAFDGLPAGGAGRLFIEICPRSFPIRLGCGTRLCQARFQKSRPAEVRPRTTLGVDLAGCEQGIVAYQALRTTRAINLPHDANVPASEFWRPIRANARRELILEPDGFYILASKETVEVPPGMCAEMVAFDATLAEARVHAAGFFDPGFGWTGAGGPPSHAVLEVRAYQMPFLLRDGQPICRMGWERMSKTPATLYGAGRSSYQGQRLALPRLFDATS